MNIDDLRIVILTFVGIPDQQQYVAISIKVLQSRKAEMYTPLLAAGMAALQLVVAPAPAISVDPFIHPYRSLQMQSKFNPIAPAVNNPPCTLNPYTKGCKQAPEDTPKKITFLYQ